jgi:hypothetical protein
MDSRDHGNRESSNSTICSLEWIALAIEAARRHKEAEHAHREPREDLEERDAGRVFIADLSNHRWK